MARHIARSAVAVLAALLVAPIASLASTTNGGGGGGISVPEPGTLALLSVGTGAAGLIAWVRGRRKK